MSSSKPAIGVFDSGVGGLTVLAAIHRRLPRIGTVYLGDTARVPYGTRSAETVTRYARNAAALLLERDKLSMLVVACNTASAVALPALKAMLDIPVLGVIEPTAELALLCSTKKRIGVIGTAGTIASGAYQRALFARDPAVQVEATACPLFVPLAEEGWTRADDPVANAIAERYLSPLAARELDCLILGCTHYPLLAGVIQKVMGPGVALIDASEAIAATVAEAVAARAEPTETGPPLRRYYVTDLPGGFSRAAERFLGAPLTELHQVDLAPGT